MKFMLDPVKREVLIRQKVHQLTLAWLSLGGNGILLHPCQRDNGNYAPQRPKGGIMQPKGGIMFPEECIICIGPRAGVQ